MDHAAVGVDYDTERKLVFVTGSVTSGGPLDERMMLMALGPALDKLGNGGKGITR